MTDVVVIGAGLAGLAAGWQAAAGGLKTRVIARGWGVPYWHSGCLDVLGYETPGGPVVTAPAEALARLVKAQPRHPYALVGPERLAGALQAFQRLCAAAGYPLHGSLERNWLLPSAAGAARPTCLAPATMIAGDMTSREPMLIAGFDPFLDFYPELLAANLERQGIPARPVSLALASLAARRGVTGVILARLFDTAEFRAEVIAALKPHLGTAARVGFPAVLGLEQPLTNLEELAAGLGRPVFEIPVLPPSVPGMRLHQLLVAAIQQAGGRVFEGMAVTSAEVAGRRVISVRSEAAARQVSHQAANFILATGGILGGGLSGDEAGRVREEVFDLPVTGPADRSGWLARQFLAPGGQPIFRAGVEITPDWFPSDGQGKPVYENVRVVGAALAHWDGLRERSLEGVTLATGYLAGQQVANSAPLKAARTIVHE